MNNPTIITIAVSLIVSCLSVYAWADDDIKPNEFAYGLTLELTPGKSLYEATLPEHLYKSIKRSDIGDLRVFNSDSEVVPHTLTMQATHEQEDMIIPPMELKLFPLYENQEKNTPLRNVKVKTSTSGAVIEVNELSISNDSEQKLVSTYLVDATSAKAPIEDLSFEFENPKNEHFITKVDVYGSDDLLNWTSVSANAVLANLLHKEETLVKNIINIQKSKYRYYNISWNNSIKPLKISKLNARFAKKSTFKAQDPNWITVEGTTDTTDDTTFLYQLDGFFPVSTLVFEFAQPNSIGNVSIFSKNEDSEAWEQRSTRTIYSIINDGAVLEDTVVRFSPERFKHWRVKFNSQKEAFGSRPPKLKFGWLPEKVRFLARGKTPFLISYGSARIGPMVGLNLQDSTFSGSVGPALVSHQSVLGGESKLTYTPPKVHPWKSWILWAVLLVAVFGLAKMALSLMKSLQNEDFSK